MNSRHLSLFGCIVLAVLLAMPAIGSAAGAGSTSAVEPAAAAHAIATVAFDSTATTSELLESAREMFIADRYDIAEMLYKSVLVRDPNNIDSMQELAIIYEATGQLQYARGLLTRALIIRPDDPEIIRRHAEIVRKLSTALESEIDSLIAIRAYEPAIPKLAILLTTQPENADLYFKKAECHLKLGNPEVALAEIERAQNIRREVRFERLKTTAKVAKRKREIDTLAERASRSLRKGTAEGRNDAMNAIARILEIDPENAWAKEQFTGGGKNLQQRIDGWNGSERLDAWWALIKKNVSVVGEEALSLAEAFEGHLNVLLAILLGLLILASPLTYTLAHGFSPDSRCRDGWSTSASRSC